MNKDTTFKMTVVRNYHSLINKKAGYANSVCVGFLPIISIFSLAFERKLKTGCGKASQIAFPNRQGVALPIIGLANSLSPERHEQRKPKPQGFSNVVKKTLAGLGLSRFGGSSKGASPLYVY